MVERAQGGCVRCARKKRRVSLGASAIFVLLATSLTVFLSSSVIERLLAARYASNMATNASFRISRTGLYSSHRERFPAPPQDTLLPEPVRTLLLLACLLLQQVPSSHCICLILPNAMYLLVILDRISRWEHWGLLSTTSRCLLTQLLIRSGFRASRLSQIMT